MATRKRKSNYGMGSIYHRGRVFWVSYMLRGVQHNESSKSETRKDAEDLLKRRMGEIVSNRALGAARATTVGDLLTSLEAHYIEKERLSLVDLKGKIAALKGEFGRIRAAEFGTADIQRIKVRMKREKYANASVNRYLEVLRHAFRRGEHNDPPLVGRVPHFEMLPVDNTRTGFVTESQYRELLAWLPEHLKGLLIFGYHLGMRKTALKNLRRDQVDWTARMIRVEQPRGAKKVGRVLPIYGDMVPWLEMQMSTWEQTAKCRWILHQDGGRIGDFRKSWATACKAAKVPGILFHDLRRSAVRNMERAGIPRSQAMAVTGHKTESTYKRYAIVSEADVKSVGEKMGRFLGAASAEKPALETRKN